MLSPAHLGHDVSVAVYGALSYPDFALSLLQCRSLIYAGDNWQFDTRISVEVTLVCMLAFISRHLNLDCFWFLNTEFVIWHAWQVFSRSAEKSQYVGYINHASELKSGSNSRLIRYGLYRLRQPDCSPRGHWEHGSEAKANQDGHFVSIAQGRKCGGGVSLGVWHDESLGVVVLSFIVKILVLKGSS
jgi:hypothetical protein